MSLRYLDIAKNVRTASLNNIDYKKNQKIIADHYLAYSLGAYSDCENSYRIGTKNHMAFILGREWKLRSSHSNPLLLNRQKG